MNRDINIVEHIIIHCKRIIEKTENISEEEFLKDRDCMEIVCFNFLQAGELVKLLSKEYCEIYLNNSLLRIAKLRDKIAHGYGTIKFNKIFQYTKNDIVKLLNACEKSLPILKKDNIWYHM